MTGRCVLLEEPYSFLITAIQSPSIDSMKAGNEIHRKELNRLIHRCYRWHGSARVQSLPALPLKIGGDTEEP